MKRLKHVIVSGAGPAGLLSALMLKRAGIDVTILERVPRSKLLSDVGGAYDLYPNTMKIFKYVGIYDSIVQRSDIFKTIRIFNKNGNIVRNLSASNIMQSSDSVPYSALRSVIQSTLLDNIINDVDIKCDSKVIDYVENDIDKTVKVICDDGKEYEGDLCIVADGIWSKLTQQLLKRNNNMIYPNYCNVQAWWGRNHESILDKQTAYVFVGFGKSFVSAQVRSTEGHPITIWSGFQYIPDKMQTFESTKDRKQCIIQLMDGFGNICRDILNGTKEDDILDVGIYDRDKIESWSNEANNVILMGDAAHPMTPFLGQGANSALTDAFIVGTLLEKYEFDINKLENVVNDYELNRMDGMYKKIVKPARSMCKYWLSDSAMIHSLLLTWMKYGPEKYMAPEIASSAAVNDISKYIYNSI